MIELLTRNLGWKIFSLLVSLLLWFSYARDTEVGAFVSAPLEYRGMPTDLEISSDVAPAVSLDVRGPSEMMSGFTGARSPVVLDFSAIHGAGEQTFAIDERTVALPSGLRLERAIPAQIHLQFERRTTRSVPVEVRFVGEPPAGIRLKRYDVDPPRVTLEGPESRVGKIDFAFTDPVDLAVASQGAVFHVDAFVSDPHVRLKNLTKIAVKLSIQEKQ